MTISNGDLEKPTSATSMSQNIEAVVAMEVAEEQAISRQQRAIEKMAGVIAQPAFPYVVLALIAAWVAGNLAIKHLGYEPWDAPPFSWLQMILAVAGIMLATIVVTTQRRHGKLDERRSHLDLQVSLIVDQKAAKIIDLLEEIRRDSPILRNRTDKQAEALTSAVDPTEMAQVIAEKLAEAEDVTVTDAAEGKASEAEKVTAKEAKGESPSEQPSKGQETKAE